MAAPERNTGLARIKTAMIEKKMTQAELADAADCHEKTIQNLMNGRAVRDQTLFDVCMVLGLDFNEVKVAFSGQGTLREEAVQPAAPERHAPVDHGAYTRVAVEHYVGSYLTVRPSFSTPGGIAAYRTDIRWDDERSCLVFEERDRADKPYSHHGSLYVPASSMFIHLVSLTKGAMRMIVVSQLDNLKQMRGIITTLHKQRATVVPVSAPIVLAKRDDLDHAEFGEIGKSSASYQTYRGLLDEATAQGYVRLIGL